MQVILPTIYIAETQRCDFLESVFVNLKFVSFSMDGSTDSGNKEQELVFVCVCSTDNANQEIKSCTRYLGIINPTIGTATGLVDYLKEILEYYNG